MLEVAAGRIRGMAVHATRRPTTLREQRRAENFPVALRLLPAARRRDLVAVYEVARVIDDLGDEAPGDRLALLDGFAADLARVWDGGEPREPVLRRLVPTVRAHHLPRQPFEDLVEANRWDQRVRRYETFERLREYCALSADPVGRIVLAVFDASTPATVALSDRVCTALQLVEHWQDVTEDRRAGRIYLPADDLRRYGVVESDLDGSDTPDRLRRLLAYQAHRAADLLDSGAPLVGLLHGWARVAVAGYVAGGRATLSALRRSRYDVLALTPRPRRRDVARHAAALLAGVGR
jgi:squalene synthase HpnC